MLEDGECRDQCPPSTLGGAVKPLDEQYILAQGTGQLNVGHIEAGPPRQFHGDEFPLDDRSPVVGGSELCNQVAIAISQERLRPRPTDARAAMQECLVELG